MSVMYPLGFLALLGIPVLIIIYIIKNKYTEQVVSSTYLWTLSEKFLKRRNPLNKIAGIISLILQILIVLFVAVALAHPVFTVPNSAYSYCFILDGSGSMNIEQNGKTRFDIAKGEIQSLVESSASGSSYTLIYAGEYTKDVYDGENKNQLLRSLDELTPSYKTVVYDEALEKAQIRFIQNNALQTYFYTDKSFEKNDNVTVVDVSSHEENYAVTGVSAKLETSAEETRLTVTGMVVSYESDTELTLEFYLDGASESVGTRTVQTVKGEYTPFTFTHKLDSAVSDYQSVKAVITNSDALALDNECIYYREGSANAYTALIVSESPFYIYSALTANKNATILVSGVEAYEAGKVDASGYDLYVFDGVKNIEMPTDGAVWIFDPQETVKGGGFIVSPITPAPLTRLTYTDADRYSPTAKRLLRDVPKNDIYLYEEDVKCRLTGEFTTILSCNGNPAVFAGANSAGNREVVFSFDLHKSNLPGLLLDYAALMRNVIAYTFPDVIEETSYVCGDTMTVNVVAGCESIRIESPLGNVSYPAVGGSSIEYTLTEVGEYRGYMKVGNTERTFRVFSEFPEEERATVVSADSFSLNGDPSDEKKDGFYSEIWFWFIIIAVLAAADWMVYCYEHYQLR